MLLDSCGDGPPCPHGIRPPRKLRRIDKARLGRSQGGGCPLVRSPPAVLVADELGVKTRMQFLSRLMPRENRFFELFNQHAKLVVAAGAVLVELLKGFTREEGKRSERI